MEPLRFVTAASDLKLEKTVCDIYLQTAWLMKIVSIKN